MKTLIFLQLLSFIAFLTGCNSERDFSPVKNITELSNTDFASTIEQEIELNKNQIYCSTLSYAWNEVKKELKYKIEIDSIFRQLQQINETKGFENSLREDEIDNSVTVIDSTIRATSVFAKSLPFEFDFSRNNFNLLFNSLPVESFGENGYNHDTNAQIKILYYENDNEFAIELLPGNMEHQILIFKPSDSKAKSIQELLNILNSKIEEHSSIKRTEKNYWKYSFEDDDVLSIPVINFNLEKNYAALEGNYLWCNKKMYTVEKAYQRIALILDEKGAKIESETEFVAIEEEMEELPKPKKLIFDKPFLLVFKRRGSVNPYLAAWIVNEELMKRK